LRLDAAHAIYDFSAIPFLRQLRGVAIDIAQNTGCKKEIIAESDLNDPKYINPPEKGGYGMDGQWNDEFHHALHALLTGERGGYYEDYGEIGQLEKAFRETFVHNGNYSVRRKKHFGAATVNPYSQFVVFTQNHDQIGNRAKGDRLANSLSLEQLKLAAATVLLSPYIPLLFMGEEYGEKNPFLFFTDFSEHDLIESIRKGRATEFRHSGAELPDPQDIETFQRSMLSWKNREGEGADLLNYYRSLISFRKTRPAMQDSSRESLLVYPSKKNILAFERKVIRDHLYVWLNFNGDKMIVKNECGHTLNRVFGETGRSGQTGPSGQIGPSSHIGPSSETTPCQIQPGAEIPLSPYSATVFEIIT